jgi:putative Mg2+ transporter-C (MgtC) family protein
MALVSLGSCLFSINATMAFLSGPMSWDASRVAAAIPSGVGFLGSALIFKHTTSESNAWHEVHGLTTAASVWLSAAVGIACGGGLYFVASLSTAIVLVMLRFGPRTQYQQDLEDAEEEEALAELEDLVSPLSSTHQLNTMNQYQSTNTKQTLDPEAQCMIPPGPRRSSRASLVRRSQRPSLM